MKSHEEAKAYIVGAGIASLSAAVLLIRDGGFRGSNIRIMEELEVAGGALDGSGDPVKGYVTRGGRMWTEEAYVCLWDVLDTIPTLADPAKSVKDDVLRESMMTCPNRHSTWSAESKRSWRRQRGLPNSRRILR
jgi:oleate hydratase